MKLKMHSIRLGMLMLLAVGAMPALARTAVIVTDVLPTGILGHSYNAYVWAMLTGPGSESFTITCPSPCRLPPGLSLSFGSITGTPLVAGRFFINFHAQGSTPANFHDKTLSLEILSVEPVDSWCRRGGAGPNLSSVVTAPDFATSDDFAIGSPDGGAAFSLDNGVSWTTVTQMAGKPVTAMDENDCTPFEFWMLTMPPAPGADWSISHYNTSTSVFTTDITSSAAWATSNTNVASFSIDRQHGVCTPGTKTIAGNSTGGILYNDGTGTWNTANTGLPMSSGNVPVMDTEYGYNGNPNLAVALLGGPTPGVYTSNNPATGWSLCSSISPGSSPNALSMAPDGTILFDNGVGGLSRIAASACPGSPVTLGSFMDGITPVSPIINSIEFPSDFAGLNGNRPAYAGTSSGLFFTPDLVTDPFIKVSAGLLSEHIQVIRASITVDLDTVIGTEEGLFLPVGTQLPLARRHCYKSVPASIGPPPANDMVLTSVTNATLNTICVNPTDDVSIALLTPGSPAGGGFETDFTRLASWQTTNSAIVTVNNAADNSNEGLVTITATRVETGGTSDIIVASTLSGAVALFDDGQTFDNPYDFFSPTSSTIFDLAPGVPAPLPMSAGISNDEFFTCEFNIGSYTTFDCTRRSTLTGGNQFRRIVAGGTDSAVPANRVFFSYSYFGLTEHQYPPYAEINHTAVTGNLVNGTATQNAGLPNTIFALRQNGSLTENQGSANDSSGRGAKHSGPAIERVTAATFELLRGTKPASPGNAQITGVTVVGSGLPTDEAPAKILVEPFATGVAGHVFALFPRQGLFRSTNMGTSFTPLAATGLPPGFVGQDIELWGNYNSAAGRISLAVLVDNAGIYFSGDGGLTFCRGPGPVTGGPNRVNAILPSPNSQDDLFMGADDGLWISNDQGVNFSRGKLGKRRINTLVFINGTSNYLLAGAVDGIHRSTSFGYNWTPVYLGGNVISITQNGPGTQIIATEQDGGGLISTDFGATFDLMNSPADGDQMDHNAATTFTETGKSPFAITAPYWMVGSASGASWSGTGSSWTAANGVNADYLLPSAGSWVSVKTLGGTPSKVLAGNSTQGLYRTLDGGDQWRKVSGAGSGLEATSQNASALLAATTSFGGIDALVGMSGATNGGVYLSGDTGAHWTQINQGFDPNNLSISSLVKTSCAGCPVQYYSGSYGSGVYTRTITVNAPPAVTGSFFGDTVSACVGTAGSGPMAGGQSFKLCGTGFQAGAAIEFDGVPIIASCTYTAALITCTSATPPHFSGAATIIVRNPDTRASGPVAYTYSGGSSRGGNSVRLAKSGVNAIVTWTCPACTAGNPARIYRSQNGAFTQNVEYYNGGAGAGTGALGAATHPSYFWQVE